MAIQPRYAQAIFAGDKHVEFRKRGLAADVDMVVVYETSPTQRIVGTFRVVDTVRRSPRGMWREFGSVGAISRPDFMSYYEAHETAVGLVVGSVRRLLRPMELTELQPNPAVPQSFSYLPDSVLDQLDAMQLATDTPAADESSLGYQSRLLPA